MDESSPQPASARPARRIRPGSHPGPRPALRSSRFRGDLPPPPPPPPPIEVAGARRHPAAARGRRFEGLDHGACLPEKGRERGPRPLPGHGQRPEFYFRFPRGPARGPGRGGGVPALAGRARRAVRPPPGRRPVRSWARPRPLSDRPPAEPGPAPFRRLRGYVRPARSGVRPPPPGRLPPAPAEPPSTAPTPSTRRKWLSPTRRTSESATGRAAGRSLRRRPPGAFPIPSGTRRNGGTPPPRRRHLRRSLDAGIGGPVAAGAFLPRSAGGPPAGSGAVALPAGGWRPYALSGPRTG